MLVLSCKCEESHANENRLNLIYFQIVAIVSWMSFSIYDKFMTFSQYVIVIAEKNFLQEEHSFFSSIVSSTTSNSILIPRICELFDAQQHNNEAFSVMLLHTHTLLMKVLIKNEFLKMPKGRKNCNLLWKAQREI